MDHEEDQDERVEFYEMGIDDRLLKAISLLGWSQPTLIQEKAIPLALEGHDILARARTGSGKTGVFAIPVIDKILKERQRGSSGGADHVRKTRALIVVPSKELSRQTYTHINQLTSCCSREVRCIDVGSSEVKDLRALLKAEPPDILIGTPSKLLAHIQAGTVKNLKSSVKYFVVDEADLLFSFGFEDDIQQLISTSIPSEGCQSYLVSATLNADVINLKNLVLHRPVVVRLDEPELPECAQLAQYHINCEEEEKFVLINALMRLNLIRGRTIIFVRSLTRCYKLKIFLEIFAIKSCVLNPELPVSTRCNIVERFNSGVYDIIIACDEKCVHDPTERLKSGANAKGRRRKLDKDYGISRGIDFQSVSNVINFDFPTSVTAYIHRVGRTARAINATNASIEEGTVLSFISREEMKYFEKVKKSFESKTQFRPYAFKMDELEAFRYRSRDALRAVTKGVIHEARAKEIRQEIRNSERLKSFMVQHPSDAKILRHDKTLRNVRVQTHLKDMPDYIVPATLLSRKRQISSNASTNLTAPTSRSKEKKNKKKSSKLSQVKGRGKKSKTSQAKYLHKKFVPKKSSK